MARCVRNFSSAGGVGTCCLARQIFGDLRSCTHLAVQVYIHKPVAIAMGLVGLVMDLMASARGSCVPSLCVCAACTVV